MNMLVLEEKAHSQGKRLVCGVDEAGRGPLAGPVFAAAVILPERCSLADVQGIDDSKKLTEKKREELYDTIVELAQACAVASASEAEIDEYNILNATFLAMKRAVAMLGVSPDLVLVDGNRTPQLEMECRSVVKGDSKSASIAAASILAKVSRDRYMKELALQYPQYEFDRHKGYPTKLHYEKIAQFGVSPVHRKSFLKNLKEHMGTAQ